ncbi:MAG: M20/M25/M40 family metallo-hydrolase [Acidobacteriaceae bacterium]|nr:M20/M25/M40 family metallo-hydrolase [Acidobacteriaceae bacterium]
MKVPLIVLACCAMSIYAQNPTAELLEQIIRIDNSNPPGNEAKLDDLLAAKLKPLGFEIDIIPTPRPGKSHLIARLKGNGSAKPILLASHGDTVGVEREKWSVDAFGAVEKDGYIYGRGAIDFKGGIAVFGEAVMELARNKVPLRRDVIWLVEADEESAPFNTTWLAERAWDKMNCEFALNEGGWTMKQPSGRVRYVSISTADKSSLSLLITARGTSTHSSMPRPDNAIFTLANALARLSHYDTKPTLTASTKQFFLTLARTSEPPMSTYFSDLVNSTDPVRVAKAADEISTNPLLHAIMRNTIAPVLLNAGFRGNVIPGSAQATINMRLIPGTKTQDIVAEIQNVIGDPNVTVEVARPAALPDGTPFPRQPSAAVKESTTDTELYQALARNAGALWNAPVTPYLFQAGTDANAWRSRGVPVYGVYPYPITDDDLSRMHGNDERVPIQSLEEGRKWIYTTLVQVAGSKTK